MSEFSWNEFKPAEVQTPNRDPIPAGEYVAVVTESAIKQNKAGTGEYLAVTFQLAEGAHEGRFVWENFNLVHPNEKAVQIARAELASLCRAVGVMEPKDSADLHHKPVLIRVGIEKDRDGNPRSVVKSYKPAASRPPQPAASATPRAEAKSSIAPWKRK